MRIRVALAAAAVAAMASACAKRVHDTRAQVPAPPSMMRRQVLNAVDAGDGDYRVRQLRARVAAEPDNLAARMELASLYLEAGYPEVAVEHYRLAAERFPLSEDPRLALVRTLRSMRMPHEALAALGAPRSADAWSWAGILRDEIADLPGAEQAHRQAVALDPGSDRLRNNLGFNLLLQGRREEAAEEFRRALELNPTSEFARNNLLTATATLQATGNDATAHSNYAAVLIEQGRYEEARKEVAIALSYDIGHPAALSNLRLLSALDGGALVLPGSRTGTLWDRMSRTLLKALLGIEDKPAGAAEKGSE